MQKAVIVVLCLILVGCNSKKQDYSQQVVFSGGEYREIKAVRIENDGGWIGISYMGDCAPSTVFYKRKGENVLIRSDQDGREYCVPNTEKTDMKFCNLVNCVEYSGEKPIDYCGLGEFCSNDKTCYC